MNIPLIAPQLAGEVSKMLWDFGFRHHPNLQTKWINGAAGLGGVADMVDEKPPVDPVEEMAEEFLKANNPKLLEAVRKAPAEQKAKLLADLEENYKVIGDLVTALKNVTKE